MDSLGQLFVELVIDQQFEIVQIVLGIGFNLQEVAHEVWSLLTQVDLANAPVEVQSAIRCLPKYLLVDICKFSVNL